MKPISGTLVKPSVDKRMSKTYACIQLGRATFVEAR